MKVALPIWPESNSWMHSILSVQPENRTPDINHRRRAPRTLLLVRVSSGAQEGVKTSEQRLVIEQMLRLGAGHRGLELLVVADHHKLLEAEFEGNQSLGFNTLTGLVHHTNGNTSRGFWRPNTGHSCNN